MSQEKRRIFVLYTGGTIGMVQSGRGLRPDAALTEKALLPFSDGLSFDWHICAPLIDSSAVTLENWRDWLALLVEKIPQYDGVLVLHGTDTLAYTANPFALARNGRSARRAATRRAIWRRPPPPSASACRSASSPLTANCSPPSAAARSAPKRPTVLPTRISARWRNGRKRKGG